MNKFLLIIGVIIIILLGLAPWLDNKSLHDKAIMEKAKIDKTLDQDGELICDYNVRWVPFGRWVASCEGGYYVTFWGAFL